MHGNPLGDPDVERLLRLWAEALSTTPAGVVAKMLARTAPPTSLSPAAAELRRIYAARQS